MGKTQITRKPSGQLLVEGAVILLDEAGKEIPHGERFTLCGCGKSKKAPICDGSHKES